MLKHKGSERLFTNSLTRSSHLNRKEYYKQEKENWERVLASTNKIEKQKTLKFNQHEIETDLESIKANISSLSPSSVFLSFPKEKLIKTSKRKSSIIPLSSLARSVKSLQLNNNTKNGYNFKTGIDMFPKPTSHISGHVVRPMSSTVAIYDNLRP